MTEPESGSDPTSRHDNDAPEEAPARTRPTTTTPDRRTERVVLLRAAMRALPSLRDLCLMAAFAFTYATLTHDGPKISKAPVALPFFPRSSIVKDYFRGELSRAIQSSRRSDIAFVMYYAPWDSNSQEARSEFELAAELTLKLVTFAAINCWQPDGECRNQYNKVYSWPVFIAYPSHGRGIQYGGPFTALHMVRFLYSVMNPIERISAEGLDSLRQKYDAVVVANLDPRPGSIDYGVFYTTSLRFLERDPFREVGFAVTTNSGVDRKITLYTWNSTITYSEDKWRPDDIINWIIKMVWQVTVWASPNGSKSLQLSRYIQPGPGLILFTPRNPMYESYDYYDLLREVALEYHYCKNLSVSYGAYRLSLGIHNNRISNYKKHSEGCINSLKDKKIGIKEEIKPERILTVSNVNFYKNNSYCIQPRNKKDYCILKEENNLLWEKERLYKRQIYDNVPEKPKSPDDHLIESYKNVFHTSMITGYRDPRSPKNLLKSRFHEKCRLKELGKKLSPMVFSGSTIDATIKPVHDVTGFACKSNRSLSIVALDSLKYHHFAEALGIDLLNTRDRTAVVIVDEKMESHYVLNGEINDKTLREFVYKFYENCLNRSPYSSSRKVNFTHVYSIRKKDYFVEEIFSENFLKAVTKRNTAVVVLYHTKQCAFCGGISYKFLTVAKLFSYVTDLDFARIDGELNSLPWEYTMETYPTILFFPETKKSESRVFPRSTPINVTNLINFILTNLTPALKIQAMWSICNQSKFEDENRKCISSVRLEVLSLIEKTLSEWRKADIRAKPYSLNKLRTLRALHLMLGSPEDVVSVRKLMDRLHAQRSEPSKL